MKAETNLQKILAQGKFAVTTECTPPRGTDVDSIQKNAAQLKGKVDAVNVNDNPTANVRMSSWALSKILLDMGIEPVFQMVTRDRNRIALQSDLLGASALGIQNVLCLTGDHQARGDHPQAKKVFDLDSIQWIMAVKQIRDKGLLMNGKKISGAPKFFIGGVANPFVESIELHIIRLQKKINEGVDFIQTQPVLDIEHFKKWINQATEQGLTDKCPIIAGVMLLKSVKMARYLKNNVPGIMIPNTIIDRLAAVPEDKQQDEGINICIERVEELKQIKGVKGVHIMAIGCEEKVAEIVDRAGLLPRPDVS
ncbi:MAG: methylenetetrahydrofolate reductase [Deltaproteobacteria bacterium]|nr:methylenetetrahydrofolate reductase [Deltaproteobacteria bacterium]